MTLISRHFIIAVSLALTIAACDTKEGDKKGDAIVAVDDQPCDCEQIHVLPARAVSLFTITSGEPASSTNPSLMI